MKLYNTGIANALLSNDRRNTDIDIVLSSSDDNDEERRQSNLPGCFARVASPKMISDCHMLRQADRTQEKGLTFIIV